MSALCYCTDCQHATGGAFSAGMMVPKESFKLVKGQLKTYEVTTDTGNKLSRGFCSNCGAPVMNQLTAMPTLVEITAGSLDDQSKFNPTVSIFMSSAKDWAPVRSDISQFPKMPG
jgi:hypothetical protein